MGIIKQLFRSGKSGREREVDRLYELYKAPFVSFLRKQYGIDEETALDLYQDSFSTLCQNVQNGNYTEGHTLISDHDNPVSARMYRTEIIRKGTPP